MALMGWNDIFYLIIGTGLGLGINRLLNRQSRETQTEAKSEPEPTNSTVNYEQQYEALAKQYKQTQLAYQMTAEICQFKAGFLARTSHELRSPLSSMIGTLQLITADLCDSPEEERQFVQQANDAALKLVGMIDDVVFVSKVDYGSEKIELQPISLAKILGEIEELTYLQAANRSIRLEISSPEPDIQVMADERRLKQVLVSLIDTAIAEMERGSINVSIDLVPDSGYVHIWIDDQRPISAWSESWDLLKQELEGKVSSDFSIDKSEVLDGTKTHALSPGMRLLMNQTLLEFMQGRLEVVAVPNEGVESNFTRTQCSVPLVKT